MNTTLHRWLASLPSARPIRPLIALSRRTPLVLSMEGLLLLVGIWASLALSLPGEYARLEVGQPSPQSIVAPHGSVYISDVLTAERQSQVETSPENLVYLYDPQTPITQRAALTALLDTVGSVRSDPSLNRAGRLAKLTALPNASVALSPERATMILALDEVGWNTLRQETISLYNRALNRYDYAIDEQALIDLRERWLTYWLATTSLAAPQRDLAFFFTQSFLLVNRTLDEKATAARRQSARDKVPPQQVRVLAGESIVRVGEIVRPETIEKLQQTGAMPLALSWLGVAGRGMIAALLAAGFMGYSLLFHGELARRPRSLLVIICLLDSALIITRLILPLAGESAFLWPLASLAIIIAVVFNSRLGLAASVMLCLSIGVMLNNGLPLAFTLLASCTVAIFAMRNAEHMIAFVVAGVCVGLTVAASQLAFWMLEQPTVRSADLSGLAISTLLFAGMNGALSTILSLGVFNMVSRAAGQVTPLQLMELAHPSRPLLRRLIREAPGTYYHSVAVGNLAEAAAEAVGADALLLRVAAYYHDIGKTTRPYFFTDNQMGRENVHNDLDPQTSAQIIVDHVREGVKMARAAGLPQQITDFIATHHGTGLIRHFYQQALQLQDSVDQRDFRYPGPRPQTREQGILMLADSVEATVRSKAQNGKLLAVGTPGDPSANGSGTHALDDLVQSIISARVREGELDESPLTMRELALIKHAFVISLQSIYHPRVDYAPQMVR
ncbi:MAG: HDIG domain-containing metalloprotein [Chloroflexales bacterium]